jgi:hypothetical protein
MGVDVALDKWNIRGVMNDAERVGGEDGKGLPPLERLLQGYALNEVERVGIEGFEKSDRSAAEGLTADNFADMGVDFRNRD